MTTNTIKGVKKFFKKRLNSFEHNLTGNDKTTKKNPKISSSHHSAVGKNTTVGHSTGPKRSVEQLKKQLHLGKLFIVKRTCIKWYNGTKAIF